MGRLRMLFFGMGSIGKRHYSTFRRLFPEFEYYAFRRAPGSYDDDLKSVFSWEQVQDLGFEAAMICSPTDAHVATAIECAKRGINLFIEKPLSDRLDGVEELLSIQERSGLHALVGCNLRFHPVVERVREVCLGQKVLSFAAYCGSYLPEWRNGDYRISYSADRARGGGVVLDLIHEIDYCTWLFGLPSAVVGRMGHHSLLEITSEDHAELVLGYPSAIGTIHLDYFRRVPKRTLEVITEEGVIEADLLSGLVKVRGVRSLDFREEFDRDTTYERQARHFIQVLTEGIGPRTPIKDGVSVLSLALSFKLVGEDAEH
jgi:predicted dehydrogenase